MHMIMRGGKYESLIVFLFDSPIYSLLSLIFYLLNTLEMSTTA